MEKEKGRNDIIKLTFCVCRKDGLSEEEFHDYWLNTHGPLVKSVAELWWKEEDFGPAGEMPEGQAAAKLLIEDEAKFIDFSRSPLWFNREHVIFQRD